MLSMMLGALALFGCANPPSHQPTFFERARSVRLEIRKGHFSKAEEQVSQVLAKSRIGRWHFAPLAAFLGYVSAPSDAEFADRLNAWVTENPRSPLPRLIRANYHYNQGWWIRGNAFASDIDSAHFERFRHELGLAAEDINNVVQRAPDNPYARYLDLLIARDTQSDAVQEAIFKQAIAKFPDYYSLYFVRLSVLQPKWGGSTDAMTAFVKQYADAAPSGSPLKMLHLTLYADLLNAASLDCGDYQDSEEQDGCVERAMDASAGNAVTRAARAAIQTFAKRDDADAVAEVEASLDPIALTPGGGTFAARLLQSAAEALHSDPQLVTDNAGDNDYAVDRVALFIWYQQGNYTNAVTLGRRAIKDLANTRFANGADADEAKAGIYRDLVLVYAQSRDYQQAAAYGEAAAQLSGGFGAVPEYDMMTCEALFRLQRYSRALQVCSDIIDASEDLQARFFRARVYDATRRDREALADYRAVADSEASIGFRTYSAIAISLIYDKQNNFQDALNSLNEFGSLFAGSHVSRESLAAYYNDRCYDKMKLGHSKAALDDCNISLQYGNIPDAVSKQQLLMHLLGKPSDSTSPQDTKISSKNFH